MLSLALLPGPARGLALAAMLSWVLAAPAVRAQDGAPAGDIETTLRTLAQGHVASAAPKVRGGTAPHVTRIEVKVGELDSRMKLAPCRRMQPYLPPGLKPWGHTRIGVRCVEGPKRWNVYLPVTVRVFAEAWVASAPLSAGVLLAPAMVRQAEVDLAASPSPAVIDLSQAVGRKLATPLSAGEALRSSHLRPKQWFAAGDTVKVIARGRGFSVSGEGRALMAGLDGQSVRVRTDNGRVLTGIARAEGTVEVRL